MSCATMNLASSLTFLEHVSVPRQPYVDPSRPLPLFDIVGGFEWWDFLFRAQLQVLHRMVSSLPADVFVSQLSGLSTDHPVFIRIYLVHDPTYSHSSVSTIIQARTIYPNSHSTYPCATSGLVSICCPNLAVSNKWFLAPEAELSPFLTNPELDFFFSEEVYGRVNVWEVALGMLEGCESKLSNLQTFGK